MAIVYTRMGMTDEAIKMYQRALEKDPDSAGAHYGIAFLYLNRGRETEAAVHLDAFLRSGAEHPGVGETRRATPGRLWNDLRSERHRGGRRSRADAVTRCRIALPCQDSRGRPSLSTSDPARWWTCFSMDSSTTPTARR